jgi:hypothetical protein
VLTEVVQSPTVMVLLRRVALRFMNLAIVTNGNLDFSLGVKLGKV